MAFVSTYPLVAGSRDAQFVAAYVKETRGQYFAKETRHMVKLTKEEFMLAYIYGVKQEGHSPNEQDCAYAWEAFQTAPQNFDWLPLRLAIIEKVENRREAGHDEIQ